MRPCLLELVPLSQFLRRFMSGDACDLLDRLSRGRDRNKSRKDRAGEKPGCAATKNVQEQRQRTTVYYQVAIPEQQYVSTQAEGCDSRRTTVRKHIRSAPDSASGWTIWDAELASHS
jgi:hypothetical protein